MLVLHSLILGLLQGVTEFLPISSSGHLLIAQRILGYDEPLILFDIILHLGTLTSTLIHFRSIILSLTKNDLLKIFIATTPLVVISLLLKNHLDYLYSSLLIVSLGFLATSLLLLATKHTQTLADEVSAPNAFFIGLAQAFALIPGVSRSGSTISAGLVRGINSPAAYQFSFLISIPAILGALIFQTIQVNDFSSFISATSIIGFISAFISGLITLKFLRRILLQHKLHYFSFYLILVSIISLAFSDI